MTFAVAAIWRAKPGEEDRVASTIREMTPLSRAEEKNLFYQAHVSPDDPTTFFLYEQYVDESGYIEHKETAHFQERVVNHILGFLESREVHTYETFEE